MSFGRGLKYETFSPALTFHEKGRPYFLCVTWLFKGVLEEKCFLLFLTGGCSAKGHLRKDLNGIFYSAQVNDDDGPFFLLVTRVSGEKKPFG